MRRYDIVILSLMILTAGNEKRNTRGEYAILSRLMRYLLVDVIQIQVQVHKHIIIIIYKSRK